MKKIYYITSIIVFLLFFNTKSVFGYYNYTIDSYNIDIVVNENNSYDVTENIIANFNVPKHGIFRRIPLKNVVVRNDGTSNTNRAKISNIFVNREYILEKSASEYNIKIGNPYETLTGKQNYTIKYNYNIGKDKSKKYDELYYNIIGDKWDTTINNVTFKITMPKEFDSNKVGFSSGKYGSIGSDKIRYYIDGNVIKGRYNGILSPEEALTVRVELEDGYFIIDNSNVDFRIILYFIIPIIGLVISFWIWLRYGKDDKIIETVEFYPPEGFNSLEVAFAYKGEVESRDVTSLLVYLANKGYIKIIDKDERNVFNINDSFEIQKLKEYDGNNYAERKFLNGLFESGKTTVMSSDLEYEFYTTMEDIIKETNSSKNKNKIFEKGRFLKNFITILLMIISTLTIVVVPTLEYSNLSECIFSVIILFIYLPFLVTVIKMKGVIVKFLSSLMLLFFTLPIFSVLPLYNIIKEDSLFLFGSISGFLCILGIIFCLKFMPKRNKYGIEILGKIEGFKNFLETTEKEELELKVMENPSYFYDILPFTYVLGISDIWISKFESINLEPPTWYYSSSPFNTNYFGNFIDNTMKNADYSMTTSHSSSGGGSGGGGGGCSGGGSGGGGRRLLVI